MDDVGRNEPENWEAFLKETASVPGVVLLGSIREEDVTTLTERARAIEIRAEPDDELAERVWHELCKAGKSNWPGWREPWTMSDGLLLEYVHILTCGQRMRELLRDQVAARIADPKRSLELDILRACAWAGAANAKIDASRLACTLSVSEAELSRALRRRTDEHVIPAPASGILSGLHLLRSQALWDLAHETGLPTPKKSFGWAAASVPEADLEPLIFESLSAQRLSANDALPSLIERFEKEPNARAFASALRGLGHGYAASVTNQWLNAPEVRAQANVEINLVAQIGIAGVKRADLDIIPNNIFSASDVLLRIKGSAEADLRRLLTEGLSTNALSALIETADLAALDEIFASMYEMPLSEKISTRLRQFPKNLSNADIRLLASVLNSLAAIDRDAAAHLANTIGQEALCAKNSLGPVPLQFDVKMTASLSIAIFGTWQIPYKKTRMAQS